MTLLRALLSTCFLVLAFAGLATIAGCPPAYDDDDSGDDDDSPSETSALCTGPGCSNSTDCPAAEPADGDACTFNGNCHYCEGGSDEAAGFTCDGSSFSAQGTYTCNP